MIETHDFNRCYSPFRKENNDYNHFSWLYLNRIDLKLIQNEHCERLKFTRINSFAYFVMISEKSIYLPDAFKRLHWWNTPRDHLIVTLKATEIFVSETIIMIIFLNPNHFLIPNLFIEFLVLFGIQSNTFIWKSLSN